MKRTSTECYAGAVSPETLQKLVRNLDGLNYAELDQFFENLPEELRKSIQISSYPSQQVFTGYLREWNELFKFALSRNAGVLLWVG